MQLFYAFDGQPTRTLCCDIRVTVKDYIKTSCLKVVVAPQDADFYYTFIASCLQPTEYINENNHRLTDFQSQILNRRDIE